MRFFALLWLLCTLLVPAWAQDPTEYVEVEIMHSKPASVIVWPGGKTDVVRLYGKGFELVRDVQIHRQGRKAPLEARLKVVSHGIADLQVTAAPEAVPGVDYQLIFVTPQHSYPLEFEVEVVDPNE